MKTARNPIRVDRAHGGNAPEGCIDFSASVNPFGPPPEAIHAFREAVTRITKYPPPYPRKLEARIAAWLDVDPETVIAGNGTTQLIYAAARLLRLQLPFVVIPSFSEIANALVACGSKPLPIPTSADADFCFEQRGLYDALDSGADGVFLRRPNSPTGMMVGLDEAAVLARECARRGAWLVMDEAFIEFADDARSLAGLVTAIGKLVVLRSLTKIFAIPGLRLGYLLGPADVVRKLREHIEPWSVNAVAEYVGMACLEIADGFIARTREEVGRERRWLGDELGRMRELRVFPSNANFLMIGVRGERCCGEFGRYLLDRGVAIRDLSGLPGCGPGFYRIGLRSRPDNARLVLSASKYFGVRV